MTLVEIILSVALSGIIAAMMYMVFTTSLLLAVISGDNTNVTWDAGTQMNRVIVDSSEAAGASFSEEPHPANSIESEATPAISKSLIFLIVFPSL